MEPSVSKGNKKSISVIPIFRNGTSILLDDLTFNVYKICNFIFVLDTNPISVQGDRLRYIQEYPGIRYFFSKLSGEVKDSLG